MIRYFLMVFVASCACFGPAAHAADLPSMSVIKANHARPIVKPAGKIKKRKPALKEAVLVERPGVKKQVETARGVLLPPVNEADLAWVLDPLVANADGLKAESSASAEANLIVEEPGYVSSPEMTIELNGHIVKSVQTTARIDVRIGSENRSVTWNAEDVQAGVFKIMLKVAAPAGKLPPYIPVSAIAFVTNDGRDGAVMVSLEKIVVRVTKVLLAESQ